MPWRLGLSGVTWAPGMLRWSARSRLGAGARQVGAPPSVPRRRGSAQRAREAGPFVESAELEVASPAGQTAEPGGFLQTWADALVPGVMASVAENMVGGGVGGEADRQNPPSAQASDSSEAGTR